MADWCTTSITINHNDKDKLKAFYGMLNEWSQKPIEENDPHLDWLGNIVGNSGIAKYDEKNDLFIPRIPCRGSLLSLDYHDEKIEITTSTAYEPLLEMWELLRDKYLPDAEILFIAKEPNSDLYCSNDPDVIGKYDIDIWGEPPEGFENEASDITETVVFTLNGYFLKSDNVNFDDVVSEEKTIEFLQRVFDTDEEDINVLLEQIDDIEDPWFSVNKYESLETYEQREQPPIIIPQLTTKNEKQQKTKKEKQQKTEKEKRLEKYKKRMMNQKPKKGKKRR